MTVGIHIGIQDRPIRVWRTRVARLINVQELQVEQGHGLTDVEGMKVGFTFLIESWNLRESIQN